MATSEGRVKEKIKKILKQYDCVWWMPAAAYGRSGVSDFNVLYKGTFIAIEAKATVASKLTALQKRYLDEVMEQGGLAYKLYDETVSTLNTVMQQITWANSAAKIS